MKSLIYLLLIYSLCIQVNSSYIAAVLEYSPETVLSNETLTRAEALQIINDNLNNYQYYIQEAKQQGAQIIVFPEYGLFGWPDTDWNRTTIFPFLESIPDPSSSSPLSPLNPCSNPSKYENSPITFYLSCLAKFYSIHIVANYGDVQYCDPLSVGCRSDGRSQYNTAVAFNDKGDLLVRYHKRHLYFEEEWYDTESDGGHKSNFTTNFGVDFGLFICFDIFWEQEEVLKDFVYPTYWDNLYIPFNATFTQKFWSSLEKVNFLAANIGTDLTSSGSGIYTSGTPLAEWNNDSYQPINKLLVATVP